MFILLTIALFAFGCGKKEAKENFQGVTSKTGYVKEGQEYLQQGEVVNAIKSFDKAIQQEPTNAANYLILGQLYMRLKSYDKAADTFSAAARIAPDSGEVFYLLAFSEALGGKREYAIKAAQQSAVLFQKKNEIEKMNKALVLWKSLSDANQPPAAVAADVPAGAVVVPDAGMDK